jgi:hypothetical protein
MFNADAAVLFAMLKDQIDEYVEKYTDQNPPPPFQLYTVKPNGGHGNMQLVQKVFEGAFEVCRGLCEEDSRLTAPKV